MSNVYLSASHIRRYVGILQEIHRRRRPFGRESQLAGNFERNLTYLRGISQTNYKNFARRFAFVYIFISGGILFYFTPILIRGPYRKSVYRVLRMQTDLIPTLKGIDACQWSP